MSSSPRSTASSTESEDIALEFENPEQVEGLYETLIEKYNDLMIQLEILEGIDDDIQELRETHLDKYEYQVLAEAYSAAGDRKTAEGLRNQAEECDERIEELEENLEEVMPRVKEHFYELYLLEIQKETLEIKLKACEKYLEKKKRKTQVEAKKQAIRPASPRRYQNMASPSRLNTAPKAPSPKTPPKSSRDSTPESSPDSSPIPVPPPAPKKEKKAEPAKKEKPAKKAEPVEPTEKKTTLAGLMHGLAPVPPKRIGKK